MDCMNQCTLLKAGDTVRGRRSPHATCLLLRVNT